MRLKILFPIVLTALVGLGCQQKVQQKVEAQGSKPAAIDSPEKAANSFLESLRDNNLDNTIRQTCWQENDLTKFAPIGVKSWQVQQITEVADEFHPEEKSFVAIVDIQTADSTSPWQLQIWNSDAHFAHRRRFTYDLNERTTKFNEIKASLNSSASPLKELPGRNDISPEVFCTAEITPVKQ